jgi:hypothetical protein
MPVSYVRLVDLLTVFGSHPYGEGDESMLSMVLGGGGSRATAANGLLTAMAALLRKGAGIDEAASPR